MNEKSTPISIIDSRILDLSNTLETIRAELQGLFETLDPILGPGVIVSGSITATHISAGTITAGSVPQQQSELARRIKDLDDLAVVIMSQIQLVRSRVEL